MIVSKMIDMCTDSCDCENQILVGTRSPLGVVFSSSKSTTEPTRQIIPIENV